MKTIMILSCFVLALSCAHHDQAPQVVKLNFSEELLQEVLSTSFGQGRFPASENEKKSNQRIYFSSLYYQYKTIARSLKENSTLTICPQYHHDRLEVDSYYLPEIHLGSSQSMDAQKSEFFPEKAFLNEGEFLAYFNQLEAEVKELCEVGYSDNYFKYDNLITYHIGKDEFHQNPKSMHALLNIPVFANYYLISMMRRPYEIDYTPSKAKAFIQRAKTYWFEAYVSTAQKGRREFFAKR